MGVCPLHLMSWAQRWGAQSQNAGCGAVDLGEEGLVGAGEGGCLVPACCVAACGSCLVQPRAMLAAGGDAAAAVAAAASTGEGSG